MSHGTQKEKFQLAVRAGNHDEVAQYIPRGAANPAWKHDISAVASLSLLCTLLLLALIGHIQIAELLLDHGWNVEAKEDMDGVRPLHFAAGNGQSGWPQAYAAPPRCR